MKKALLLLGFIVLTSGCLENGFFSGVVNQFSLAPQTTTTLIEDLDVAAEAIPSEVIGGNRMSLLFTLENKGNTTLKNGTLAITDPCILNSDSIESKFGELSPGQIKEFDFTLNSSATPLERDCEVRYQTVYESKAFGSFDLVAISEDEFLRLSRRGQTSDITLFNEKTNTPIDISVAFSKEQPFQTGDKFFMYIQLADKGGNGVAAISKSSFNVTYPTSVAKLVECDDLVLLDAVNGTLGLSRDLKFSEGKTKLITCKLEAEKVFIYEKGKVEVDVNYKYTLRDSINVRVVPE